MGSYTYHRIRIVGGLGIKELLELELFIKPNQHGKAMLTGFMELERTIGGESLKDHMVKIYLLEKDGSMPLQPVFAGYIERVEKRLMGEKSLLQLQLSSGTTALDREVKSNSFQDINWSYETVIKKTIQDTPHADGIFTKGLATYPEKPLIQYCETNWEFILRLASHLHTVVYPDVGQSSPKFYFGMPKKGGTTVFSESEYIHGISPRFYELGGLQAGYSKKEFQYYEVTSYQVYEIGMEAVFQGGTYQICQIKGKLIEGELVFTYTLGREPMVSLKRKQNLLFAGMSLLGKVLSVKEETVKIHLDIDKEQAEGAAYPYEWVPDTGSVMYCMPQVGTRVSLYFSSGEETSAIAVNCIRTNGEGCGKTSRTEDRYLATEHGKELFLKPDSIGVSMEETGQFLSLLDDKGIRLDSSKKITIVAEKQVRLKGRRVCLETPVEMKMNTY